MLYWVQIRRIWRQIFYEAASRFNRLLNPLRCMERGIVHDNDRSVWQHGQKHLLCPCLKNVGINAAIK